MSERKRTSYSAEYVSENIGHSKSWLAQEIYVESTQEVDAGEPIGNEYW